MKKMTERVQHKDVRKLERNVNHQHNPPMAINRTIEISYKTPLLLSLSLSLPMLFVGKVLIITLIICFKVKLECVFQIEYNNH